MEPIFPEKQEKFLKYFTGKVRGRYLIAAAATIGVLADDDLKARALKATGVARFSPNDMYLVRDYLEMLRVAISGGIEAERFGQQVIPAFKRGYPDLFQSNNFAVALKKVEEFWKKDADYEGVKLIEQNADSALFQRYNSPFPCAYTKGIIQGLLRVYKLRGEVEETRCQWLHDSECCEYVAKWQ